MVAVKRFVGRLRSWPVLVAVLAWAGGCQTPSVNEPSAAGSAARDKVLKKLDDDSSPPPKSTAPIARPQAPDGPAAPVVPFVPAPVVPADGRADPAPTAPDITQAAALAEAAQAAPQVKVAAVVGIDNVITDDEVEQAMRGLAKEYVFLSGAARAAKEKEVRQLALRGLIERELVINDFLTKLKKNKPALIDELKEEAVRSAAARIKGIRKDNKLSEDEFLKVLRAQGVAYKAYQRNMEREAMKEMYTSQIIKQEVPASAVTFADIRRFYEANTVEFKIDDKVKWLDLFVANNHFNTPAEARAYAADLHRQILTGADMVELTKKHGFGPSKMDGIGLGEKRGDIRPVELESAVWDLSVGRVSDLLPTATGFHVVKVAERQVAGVMPLDEKVQTAIRGKLLFDAKQARLRKLVDELWRQTSVRVVEN